VVSPQLPAPPGHRDFEHDDRPRTERLHRARFGLPRGQRRRDHVVGIAVAIQPLRQSWDWYAAIDMASKPGQVIIARLARTGDLPSLLELFAASEVSPVVQPLEHTERVWHETLERQGVYVFVSEEGSRVVATCMLITAPNLLRQGKGHGFLENVVTHPDYRGLGHGSAVVRAALAQAWAADCHHVLMQSGRTDPRVHRFYEHLGFLPGRRTAYVALSPNGGFRA
jgi:GNAT superfamily N-acetyltransferase